MCEINTNIKEIIIDAIRPDDIEIFFDVFKNYYGSINDNKKNKWRMICENPELYSGIIDIDFWYPMIYAKDAIEGLMEIGRSVIIYSNKFAWNISIKKEKVDMFPAPKLDPNITNQELASKCWAPLKINIPEHISLEIKNEDIIPFGLEKELEDLEDLAASEKNNDDDEFDRENEILRNEIIELNKQIKFIDKEFNNLLQYKDDILADYELILQENKYFKKLFLDAEKKHREEKNKFILEKNGLYNDCMQYEKLYRSALEEINRLKNNML
jgi:hypothetical protein